MDTTEKDAMIYRFADDEGVEMVYVEKDQIHLKLAEQSDEPFVRWSSSIEEKIYELRYIPEWEARIEEDEHWLIHR